MSVIGFLNGIASMIGGRNWEIFTNCLGRVSRLTMNGFSTLESKISTFVKFLYFEPMEKFLVLRMIENIIIFSFVNATRILFIIIEFMRADTVHISCEKLRSRLSTSIVYVIEIELSLHDVPFEFVRSILNRPLQFPQNRQLRSQL